MELRNSTIKFIAILGFIYLSKLLLNFFIWVWIMFLRPAKNLKKEYGSWAMVTGSTSGIGRALAFELASKGLNLVLLDRNPTMLEFTSKEIEQKHLGIFTKCIVLDFTSRRGEEIVRIIEEGIKGLDLGILINNAGLAYPYAKFLHEDIKNILRSMAEEQAADHILSYASYDVTNNLIDTTTKLWTEILEKGGRILFDDIYHIDVKSRHAVITVTKLSAKIDDGRRPEMNFFAMWYI